MYVCMYVCLSRTRIRRVALIARACRYAVQVPCVIVTWAHTLVRYAYRLIIDNYTGNGIGNVIQTCRAVHVM